MVHEKLVVIGRNTQKYKSIQIENRCDIIMEKAYLLPTYRTLHACYTKNKALGLDANKAFSFASCFINISDLRQCFNIYTTTS